MRYFEKFPMVWHQLVGTSDQVMLTNLTKRVSAIRNLRGLDQALLPYKIQERETPRQFAHRVYGSFELFWVVLLINNISDIHEQWPKDQDTLTKELLDIHGYEMYGKLHHYRNIYGNATDVPAIRNQFGIPDSVTDDVIISDHQLTKVSVYDYYFEENENKREIMVLDPEYISIFIDQFERELRK